MKQEKKKIGCIGHDCAECAKQIEESQRRRARIEHLRGCLKSLCPHFRDIGRDDLADLCIEYAGDMEP